MIFMEDVSVWIFALLITIQALNSKLLEKLCVPMWFSFSLTNISLIKEHSFQWCGEERGKSGE